MFCTECGTKLEDGVKFCTECGTKVAVVEAPKSSKPMCEFCSKQLGLNRYLIGKTQSGKSLWKCPDCAKNGSSVVFSVADEIEKFKKLLDMGAITQDEFDTKKKELLSK